MRNPELQLANALVFDGHTLAVGEAKERFAQKSSAWPDPWHDGKIAIVAQSPEHACEAACGLAHSRLDALLLGASRFTPAVRETLLTQGYRVIDYEKGSLLAEQGSAPCVQPGRISLLTSGTTGTPKVVPHTWDTLFTAPTRETRKPRKWLVPYLAGTYAWYQLVTLGLFLPGEELVFCSDPELRGLIAFAARHQVDSVSATPTFWRMAILQAGKEAMAQMPLKNVVLGGEIADQPILDDLAQIFPDAKISHVYATSEAGVCAVVTDGFAGLPADLFADSPDGRKAEMRIAEGRLQVRSRFASRASDATTAEWVDTGDTAEQRGGRVYFTGRADNAIINVGGSKAYPSDVQGIINRHPDVAWSHVRAVRSPLVGYLPEASIVLRKSAPPFDETAMIAHCAKFLPDYAIPRFWTVLEKVPANESLKSG